MERQRKKIAKDDIGSNNNNNSELIKACYTILQLTKDLHIHYLL